MVDDRQIAIVKFAMHHAKLGERRRSLPRFAADILRTRGCWFRSSWARASRPNEYATEVLAQRVALPEAIAKGLMLRLDLAAATGGVG